LTSALAGKSATGAVLLDRLRRKGDAARSEPGGAESFNEVKHAINQSWPPP
jgi:hypothetical protein